MAIGSLYISQYFKSQDKKAAEKIMDKVIESYVRNVEQLDWIDGNAKKEVVDYTEKMLKFIGYHDKLETEGLDFYNELRDFPEDQFFNIGFSLEIFAADRKFRFNRKIDWSKYSQPHTVNALYSSADSSIRKFSI